MYKIMDGNEACALVSYNFIDVAGIYPITPSSVMAEVIDKLSYENKKNYYGSNVKIVEMQSEAGAIGMVHGSLQSGCMTSTFTASQGLLLMIPNMYKIAGELLPCVINVAARSLATHALSILGDHQDIYATRSTGFAILASSSVQEVMDLTNVVYLSTIKGSIPFINFFDGFRTSHELDKIEVIDKEEIKYLIDYDKLNEFRNRALSPSNPCTKGTCQNDDIYFQMTESRNSYYDDMDDIVNYYMDKVSEITGREYKPFTYYGSKNATKVIVAMGSVCETIKEVVNYLNNNGEDVGLINVHLYRPFSAKYLLDVIPESVSNIAVIDRTKEAGSNGEPLYLDVVNAIKSSDLDINVIGGRYGLSSKNTDPACIKAIFDFVDSEDNFNNFTVGINDDVTNLSIPVEDFSIESNDVEFLIYGYGSDGMVSASKDLIKITGEGSNAFVQGYFQYDSKKSGGLTKCHLRFSKEEIHSTYYVKNPNIVVVTKDKYLLKYDVLNGIKDNGLFLLVTDKKGKELIDFLPNTIKNTIKDKKIKFYTIDAYNLAKENDLDGKINTVVEAAIFKLSHVINFEYAIDKMKTYITKKFSNLSGNLVYKNFSCIDNALDSLQKIELNGNYPFEEEVSKTVFETISSGEGDSLSVSRFINKPDGTCAGGTSKKEKREISDIVPCFNSENCIMCNMCSLVCPHAVIRPYLLNDEETEGASKKIKDNLIDSKINDYKYTIGISVKDCTGCTLCEQICPGKKGNKALTMKKLEDSDSRQKDFDYLETVKDKEMPINTVKGSQFKKPMFEFSGACSGCGETPYLKLLTQLFGDKLVIANATGCSSIYGASSPSTPYLIPWANSLFEDNAEFGYGMRVAYDVMHNRIKNIIEENIDSVGSDYEVYQNYLDNDDYDNSKKLYDIIDYSNIDSLRNLKDYVLPRTYFLVGGDGWAYDIGFSGIDHVLSTNENVNILVLDTELYSNTGGQASKSSRRSSVELFATGGKKTAKKDLAKIALTYPNAYVGSISLGANPAHAVKTLLEAESYNGVSIIIAYAPCIAHKIVGGMKNSIIEEKKATACGYFPLFRYNPDTKTFTLDSKADFDKYFEFILGEDRYKKIKTANPEEYKELLEKNKSDSISRYNSYKKMDNN